MVLRRTAQQAFSLLEIVVATAILAICFLPILTQSRAGLQETEQSQESILARHFLVDMIERYRGSSPAELLGLLPTALPDPPVTLGQDGQGIAGDGLLSDLTSTLQEMKTQNGQGYTDKSQVGLQQMVNIKSTIKMSREAAFVSMGLLKDVDGLDPTKITNGPTMYKLTCRVRWMPKNGSSENNVVLTKIIIE